MPGTQTLQVHLYLIGILGTIELDLYRDRIREEIARFNLSSISIMEDIGAQEYDGVYSCLRVLL